ncbi:hypothetical protein CC86DRAFT_368244 [Ophiobolus disseminans]|uniref:Sensitive to high expression protein 9, mitochondrial n=1 Tax=Ophiobolus disseminans TaxID=1469910 RepID=A0A6A7A7M6_9PLEO|nr:hypothetical protein CC86DRAFT_368244 [Ophiobolus disseminans]
MRPLLQHASRALTASVASVASTWTRPVVGFVRQAPSSALRSSRQRQLRAELSVAWPRRSFSSATRWLDVRGSSSSSRATPMPPPASDKKTPSAGTDAVSEGPPAHDARRQPQTTPDLKEEVADNIARVPDEHLPSHRERQRWDFSKRLSELMDELLPKLAVVTQKVNTYTGTDYSGVAALRREIMEQESLVKARRSAIDTAKQALDTAHAGQASAQKEVVALLERKHSWSAGDLERYMSLIRSEHINDQAIRQAKERVISAEAALEEARTQLEKRERAQYHEEQIWSDTIRRNSTWVTFVLMGVNIFLLLLSLAILEPWRRRRMVREIKGALEAQKAAMEAVPVTATAAMSATTPEMLAAIEEEIDKVFEPATADEASPTEETATPSVFTEVPQSVVDPVADPAVPGSAPLTPAEAELSPQESIDIDEEVSAPDAPPQGMLRRWQSRFAAVAQDVVSHRIISMRRIDYTTAILQGAAAGAVITGGIIAMLRPK